MIWEASASLFAQFRGGFIRKRGYGIIFSMEKAERPRIRRCTRG